MLNDNESVVFTCGYIVFQPQTNERQIQIAAMLNFKDFFPTKA